MPLLRDHLQFKTVLSRGEALYTSLLSNIHNDNLVYGVSKDIIDVGTLFTVNAAKSSTGYMLVNMTIYVLVNITI